MKVSERQDKLNRSYSVEILKILSMPMGIDEPLDAKQSNISCAEAKGILKHTIRLIDNRVPLRWTRSE